MKYLTAIAFLLLSSAAFAQVSPPPDFGQQALGQELTETLGKEVQWRAAALSAQDKVKELQAKLDALKAAAAPAAPAPDPTLAK